MLPLLPWEVLRDVAISKKKKKVGALLAMSLGVLYAAPINLWDSDLAH